MAKLYVSNKDESARLFKSDVLEFFTHVHWSVPIILYLPVVAYTISRSSQIASLHASTAFALYVCGLAFWTITEYTLHRWVFHYEPKSAWGKYLHFMMHGVHHDYPNDTKRLVMPPSVSIPLSSLFFLAYWITLGPVYSWPFFGGFMFGYICYDEIHYATHHAPMKFGWWQKVKHHHVLHHYHNPERGFGVSSPLWDIVFGTQDAAEQKATAVES
jgi:dihydroceramide fatty acyl 2-hydroxylase